MYVAGAICTLTAPKLLYCPCAFHNKNQLERSGAATPTGVENTQTARRKERETLIRGELQLSEKPPRERSTYDAFSQIFFHRQKKFVQSGVGNSIGKYTVKQKVTNAQAHLSDC